MTEFATQTTTDGAAHLILDGPMTVYNALEVKDRLMIGLRAAPILQLDLSHVGEMDTAGIQLLILIKRESQRMGRALHIVAHSPAVREAIDFYNMDSFFGDPMVIPADH